ncbi:unnamed protein product [Medioppia subpectinata]|uniref:Uncharacterized protein n=1 Tax=Medioppia subpectinata TaxID=1979941 RepID=A0A7R9KWM7_9ACAR|nr:unnamed protein product [Medioppia subpectinata]CAG2110132.1 unnamed protein product [Medioppia subpectinata]
MKANKDSTNCYFAFRWIVCQFKREFMKSESDEYNDCLICWESIWTSHIIRKIGQKAADSTSTADHDLLTCETHNTTEPQTKTMIGSHEKINKSLSTGALNSNTIDVPDVKIRNGPHMRSNSFRTKTEKREPPKSPLKKESISSVPKTPEKHLTDAELYTLSLCLSIIRRERDLIMAQQLDATEILKHFNTLQLKSDLENILLHASHIWYWLTHDGESLLYKQSEQTAAEPTDDFDLLPDSMPDEDYYIINASNI